MKSLIRLGIAALLATTSLMGHAALVTTHYTHGSGNTWTVDLTLTNDGAVPDALPGFTAYFDDDLFASLVALNVPTGWDPILTQPVPLADYRGAFDVYVTDPAQALGTGQSQAGFSLQFEYLGAGDPGALPYEFYAFDDSGYVFLESGESSVSIAQAVPEPGSLLLTGLALTALLWSGRRRPSTAESAAPVGVFA